jgi:hypothetical protein
VVSHHPAFTHHPASPPQDADQVFEVTGFNPGNPNWSKGACTADTPEGELLRSMVITVHHYTSVAASFGMSGLNKISKHAKKTYYEDPVAYITAVWGQGGLPNFPPNVATEQDGLLNRDTQLNGWWVVLPRCPRAFHAGFTGYNRKIGGVDKGGSDNTLTFLEKYEELAFLERNPQKMVERAAMHCEHCKDVAPMSLEGYFVDRLIFCANINQDNGECLDENWPPPVSETELAVAQQVRSRFSLPPLQNWLFTPESQWQSSG